MNILYYPIPYIIIIIIYHNNIILLLLPFESEKLERE